MPEFSEANLAAYADTFALPVHYYPGSVCACLLDNNGQPNPTCPYCYLGWVYPSTPVEAEVVRTANKLKNMPDAVALLLLGGATLTIMEKLRSGASNPAFVNTHRGDVFLIPDNYEVQTDLLRRGTRDRLWAFEVSSVIRIRDINNVLYVATTDYALSGRDIVWVSGRGPAVGVAYTCDFNTPEQYMVFLDASMSRGGGGTGAVLPKKVMATKRTYQESAKDHPLSAAHREFKLSD